MVTYYLQINGSAPVENLSHRVNPFVVGHPGCTVCGFHDHSENVRVVVPPRPRSGGGRVPDRLDTPRWDGEKERAVTPDAAHVPSEARLAPHRSMYRSVRPLYAPPRSPPTRRGYPIPSRFHAGNQRSWVSARLLPARPGVGIDRLSPTRQGSAGEPAPDNSC